MPETTRDILEEFGALTALEITRTLPPESSLRDADDRREFLNLLRHLGFEPIAIDKPVRRSGLTAEQVSSMLMVLELHRHIASAPGGVCIRIH